MKKPRYKGEITEKTKVTHRKFIGKANDSMADLLEAMDNDLESLTNTGFLKTGKAFTEELQKIDADWVKLWARITGLAKRI